jgi:hypothetical protein
VIPVLRGLIADARSLANDHPCASTGHLWESDAGRACQRGGWGASQAVYRCARCAVFDYGEPGGPGHADCYVRGPCSIHCDEADACA